jgi:WD40 repeat protein
MVLPAAQLTFKGDAALWDAGSAKQIGAPLAGSSQRWGTAAFDPRGRMLATAFQDGTVLLWGHRPGLLAGAGLRRR